MNETTCAACDCDLGPERIAVTLRGVTVEICCDACAIRLNEAHASTGLADGACPMTGSVTTPSGRIGYVAQGAGPVALFVHGVLLSSALWRHQMAALSDIRRCIALDLLAHGTTEIAPDQDVSVTANAHMIMQFLDALGVDQVDLVGNDSGGGIAQIFAALYPERIRSLTLTDCDAHDLSLIHI